MSEVTASLNKGGQGAGSVRQEDQGNKAEDVQITSGL